MRMQKYRVVIADDDASSRLLLRHFIQLFSEFEVIGEAASGEELYYVAIKEKPEIVLVDINMPDLNGMEAVKLCKESIPALQVIFTTGYEDFAVEAFNISAADYIVKPIGHARLFMALDKAKRSIMLSLTQDSIPKQFNKLSIKSNNSHLYLSVDEILYIEKEGRKTILHTLNERYETSESLQDIEGKLPDYFYKTHRSFLVNLTKIVKIKPSGETYLAGFTSSSKIAHISKLKINDVQTIIEHKGLQK